jgi:hypothetical protein
MALLFIENGENGGDESMNLYIFSSSMFLGYVSPLLYDFCSQFIDANDESL